jgi:hypothetical protein
MPLRIEESLLICGDLMRLTSEQSAPERLKATVRGVRYEPFERGSSRIVHGRAIEVAKDRVVDSRRDQVSVDHGPSP